MIIWIIDSFSGVKLLYKSFLMINTDEDLISGLLTAFHQFSMVEFQQKIESIEMAGLKWIYELDTEHHVIFVIADIKHVNTEILAGRLVIIKKVFLEMYGDVFIRRGNNWEGDINVFNPFLDILEKYHAQWEEVDDLDQFAELYDVIHIFEQILILLGNIINTRLYQKIRTRILNEIDKRFNALIHQERYVRELPLHDFTFSKNSWFNLMDASLVQSKKFVVIDFLKKLTEIIIESLKKFKGTTSCYKYFNEEGIFRYLYKNMGLLKELNLDLALLKLFLLL